MEQMKAKMDAMKLLKMMDGMNKAQRDCVWRVIRLVTSTSGSVYNQVFAYIDEVSKGGMAFTEVVSRLEELEQTAAAAKA